MFKPTHVALFIGKKKEKEALKICKNHLEKVLEAITAMKEAVYALCNEDKEAFDNALKLVFDKEKEADEAKRAILDELSRGPFHPMDREDIIRLIFSFSYISANAKAVVRKLLLIPFKEVTQEVKTGFKEISDLVIEEAKKLEESYDKLQKDSKEAIKLAYEVEKVERKIDDLRLNLLNKLLDTTKTIKTMLMLKDALDNMENVADGMEESVDIIRSIAIARI